MSSTIVTPGHTAERVPERSRNAKAQARHRAKRKAYIEQLENTVTKLQSVLGYGTEELQAIPPPLAKIRELEDENRRLQQENEDLRHLLAETGQGNVYPGGRVLPQPTRAPSAAPTLGGHHSSHSMHTEDLRHPIDRDYKRRRVVEDVFMADAVRVPPLSIPPASHNHHHNHHAQATPTHYSSGPTPSSTTSSHHHGGMYSSLPAPNGHHSGPNGHSSSAAAPNPNTPSGSSGGASSPPFSQPVSPVNARSYYTGTPVKLEDADGMGSMQPNATTGYPMQRTAMTGAPGHSVRADPTYQLSDMLGGSHYSHHTAPHAAPPPPTQDTGGWFGSPHGRHIR